MSSSADVALKCTVAIIVAGGTGARFGGSVPKQFLPLCGVPLIERAIALFLPLPEITAVDLVLPAAELHRFAEMQRRVGDAKLRAVVAGGATRRDSVWNGLQALAAGEELILVHDAARPFADPALIRAALRLAAQCGGAILAERITDTLKLCAADRTIRQTLNREEIWRAQTPQVFRRELLECAYRHAIENNLPLTDEAQAVELLGGTVQVVESTSANLKITHPEDFARAELYLKQHPDPFSSH